MSHRLTNEDLDEEFELFLKEPVSDDSIDFGGSLKQSTKSRQKSAQKPAVPWWQDDEHSGGGKGTAETKSRFVKGKKSQPGKEVVSVEPFYKPVPKPRSKAVNKSVQMVKTQRHIVLEASQTVDKTRTPSKDSSSDSMSTDENLDSESGHYETHPSDCDGPFSGDSEDGLLGLQGSLMNSLKKSQTVEEEEEEEEDSQNTCLKKEEMNAVVFNRDIAKADGMNMTMGLDTLEEEEEKARFFAHLEAGISSAIDYSKLNKELDTTASTISNNLRKGDKSVEQIDEDQRKIRDTEAISFPSSPHYSGDFEEDKKEPQEERSKLSPILAKVSLYDSLDDYLKKNTVGSLDRVLTNMQSGDTEIEALHEAYRQIHVVENSDDQNSHYRPISPSSPPHQTRPSLQHTSTNESELPTAEELLKPIRPEEDYIRGFTLQPVSDMDLKRSSQDASHIESTLTQPGRIVKDVTEIKGNKGSTSHQPSCPETHGPDLTWSIRKEVKKLMQDHQSCTSPISCDAGKAKKYSAFSSIAHPSTSSVRKSTVAPIRGRRALGMTAVTPRSKGISRTAAPAKIQPSVSSGTQHAPKASCTKSNQKHNDTADPGLKVSSELVASVQSLVTVLQQQIHTSSFQDPAATRNAEDAPQTEMKHQLQKSNRDEDTSVVQELRVQLAERESQLQLLKEEAEELQSLRQQNFLLQSKLRSAEEESQKSRWANATDAATEDKFQQIDKEMKEQEMLINGYQQENEKLYLQMKAQQAKSKANEEAMFSENQRLLNELAFTREQLNQASRPGGNVCLMDHTQRITELLAKINTFQKNEAKASADIHRLKQEKQALEVDLQLMKKERHLAKAQGIAASGDKTFEMHVLENKHREEVMTLRKKLQWFSENQELLDRDANRLKAATAEIHQLKEQVEHLKMEVSKKSSEQQRKAKVKFVDTKRMKDLERQVKELEQILRHRNPNSLPALIYAVASASQQNTDTATSPPSRSTALLECRIQRLEAELESHDEEAKQSLRAMEQQLQQIKLSYEQRISELELQHQQQDDVTTAETAVQVTLKDELQQMKEAYQEKEKGLCDQIESLQQQLKHKAQSSGRHQRQAEVAFGVRIEHMNQELSTKTRTIQELTRTVARLQKEKTSVLSGPNSRPETRSAEPKRQPSPTKSHAGDTFPAAQYEKTYQPTVFTGSHISEVLQENEALRQRLEQLQLQTEQRIDALKADAAQSQEELHRLQEHYAEQLSSMKAEHLRVLDQLRTTYTLEHSSSKVAELTNKLNTQEIRVKHLEHQITELQGAKDALVVSRSREEALQNQLTRLLKELKEAKEAQSSEVKLLCSLERKLLNMELRHQHRENELQQVISGSWQTQEANLQSEVERWRRFAQEKSRELEAFRQELDSIMDILRHLQRQGAVFSTLDHQQLPMGANTLTDVSER